MSFSVDMYFMVLSIVAGITIYFQPHSPLHLKLFPLFLLYTLMNEILAGYMVSRGEHTTLLYNIYDILEFNFYIYFFLCIVKNKKAKFFCKALLAFYFSFSLFNLLFFQGIGTYNSITYAAGCLSVVALCVYYFFELFKLKHFVNLAKEPSFWISAGLLFYFSCSFPLLTTANFIQNISEIIINSLQSLILLMNTLLYSLFTIAFLCRIRIQKYTLS